MDQWPEARLGGAGSKGRHPNASVYLPVDEQGAAVGQHKIISLGHVQGVILLCKGSGIPPVGRAAKAHRVFSRDAEFAKFAAQARPVLHYRQDLYLTAQGR